MREKIEKDKRIAKNLSLWVPALAWILIIFTLSSFPTTPVSEIHWKDFVVKKIAHVFEYAILTILLYRALKGSRIEKRKALLYSFVISVFYGVSDEIHQAFTPGREPKARDILFDTIGAGLSIFGIWNFLPKAPSKLKRLAKSLQLL